MGGRDCTRLGTRLTEPVSWTLPSAWVEIIWRELDLDGDLTSISRKIRTQVLRAGYAYRRKIRAQNRL